MTPDDSFYQSASAILKALGAPLSDTSINLLVAWSWCEKPHYAGGSWQWNNPLNTTQPGFNATGNANSVGVKIYPTQSDGVNATVATLTNGYYPNIVQALKAGNANLFFNSSYEIRTWGTDPGCIQTTYNSLGPVPSWVKQNEGGGEITIIPPPPIITSPFPRYYLLGAAVAISVVALGVMYYREFRE